MYSKRPGRTVDPQRVLVIALGEVARYSVQHLSEGTPESRAQLTTALDFLHRVTTEMELES